MCIILNSDIDDNFDDDLTKSFPILTSKLSDIKAQYSMLGLQLGISVGKIKEIESCVVDVKEYLQKMLVEWNKEKRPLTDILEAIRSPSIGNMRFAREKWINNGLCQSHYHFCATIIIIYSSYATVIVFRPGFPPLSLCFSLIHSACPK